MSIEHPILLGIAGMVLAAAIGVIWRRRPPLPRGSVILIILGAALLALASAGPSVDWPRKRTVSVLVDRSPSMRTAAYADPDALNARVKQLLGSIPFKTSDFSDPRAEQTQYSPPGADAILLFSDARFALPKAAAPTYIVVDPNLEHPADAAVISMEHRGGDIIATVRNPGIARQMRLAGTAVPLAGGDQVISQPVGPEAKAIVAALDGSDSWPENDTLSLRLPPPPQLQQWWIGASAPDAAWQSLKPADLPADPSDYLSTSIIVLNNTPAGALTAVQQDRLMQYVRDLGGGLVIIGGDNAFAAGGYQGSAIGTLSPLASHPPESQRQWVVLVDSSGSMAAELPGGGTRWTRAAEAAMQLLPQLPPEDLVHIGDFARDVGWWSTGKTAAAAARTVRPPTNITPQGPTNLQAAIDFTTAQLVALTRVEIIIISDADATIDDPTAFAALLRQRRVRLNLLATADASKSPVLRVVTLTGGVYASQPDPRLWAEDGSKLLRATLPNWLYRGQSTVKFASQLAGVTPQPITQWNRTWLKSDAAELASADVQLEVIPVVAHCNIGTGKVAAAAFAPNAESLAALAGLVARAPRDPRFKIARSSSPALRVSVDAATDGQFINDLALTLALSDPNNASLDVRTIPIPQTAPGHYQITAPGPRNPSLAIIRAPDAVIDRFTVAGRYAPEFDAIGNDRAAMSRLAELTDGAVIEPSQTSPIDFHWPTRRVSLISTLATIGAALIAAGLIILKLR